MSQESQNLASVMVPLTQKLISQYYTIDGAYNDGTTEYLMKQIIASVLTERILDNWFLTVASFLDPRFQTYDMSMVQRIREYLEEICCSSDFKTITYATFDTSPCIEYVQSHKTGSKNICKQKK